MKYWGANAFPLPPHTPDFASDQGANFVNYLSDGQGGGDDAASGLCGCCDAVVADVSGKLEVFALALLFAFLCFWVSQ